MKRSVSSYSWRIGVPPGKGTRASKGEHPRPASPCPAEGGAGTASIRLCHQEKYRQSLTPSPAGEGRIDTGGRQKPKSSGRSMARRERRRPGYDSPLPHFLF